MEMWQLESEVRRYLFDNHPWQGNWINVLNGIKRLWDGHPLFNRLWEYLPPDTRKSAAKQAVNNVLEQLRQQVRSDEEWDHRLSCPVTSWFAPDISREQAMEKGRPPRPVFDPNWETTWRQELPVRALYSVVLGAIADLPGTMWVNAYSAAIFVVGGIRKDNFGHPEPYELGRSGLYHISRLGQWDYECLAVDHWVWLKTEPEEDPALWWWWAIERVRHCSKELAKERSKSGGRHSGHPLLVARETDMAEAVEAAKLLASKGGYAPSVIWEAQAEETGTPVQIPLW